MLKLQKECNPAQPSVSAAEIRPIFSSWRVTWWVIVAMAITFMLSSLPGHALTAAANDTAAAPVSNPQASAPAATGTVTEAPAAVRVVRLSDVEGTVQIVRENRTEFSHAMMNMPVAQGSSVETGPDGRAEIEFEDGSVTRITPNSSLNLEKLATSPNGVLETTLRQQSGLVYYELRSDPQTSYTVAIGQGTVTPKVNSTFRVDLGATPPAVAVIDGNVQVAGASDNYQAQVHQGQTIEFHPSASSQYTVADGIIPNGFDQWNDQRDEEAAKQAANQTPARVQQGAGSVMDSGVGYGWGDLDSYGGWYPLPGYGMVWQPYGAGPGFDPYGFGGWANVGGFGISWVSGYPWGWLPFQCGGWSYIGSFGWGWMPGGCGFGGIGYGYGGYYGRRGYYYRGHPYTNIYRGPAGYHAPVPPTTLRAGAAGGHPQENFVHVGSSAISSHEIQAGRDNARRTVNFNGSKIAPLHSDMRGVSVPTRNAALYNNYPARAFPGGVRDSLAGRNGGVESGLHGTARAGEFRSEGNRSAEGLHSLSMGTREGVMRTANGEPFATHAFGAENHQFGPTNRASFGNVNSFGQHAVYGSHGSFGGVHSSFEGGGEFRGGSMGGSGYHGGFHGGGMSSGGGYHGGAVSSGAMSSGGGFHGGGMSAGGGFHGGGGGGGGHGGGGGGGHGR